MAPARRRDEVADRAGAVADLARQAAVACRAVGQAVSGRADAVSDLARLGCISLSKERIEFTDGGRRYLLGNLMSKDFASRSQCSNVCQVQVDFLLWLFRENDSGNVILSDPRGYDFEVGDCIDLLHYAGLIGNPSSLKDYRSVTHFHGFVGEPQAIILKELREFGFIEQFFPEGAEPVPPILLQPRPGTVGAEYIDASNSTSLMLHREKWLSTGPVRLTAAGAIVAQQEQSELDATSLRRDLLNWIRSSAKPTYSAVAIPNFFEQGRAYWWFGRRSVEVSDAVEYLVREGLTEFVAAEDPMAGPHRPWPDVRVTQLGLRCVEEFGGDPKAMRKGNDSGSTGFNIGVLHVGDQNKNSGDHIININSAIGAQGRNAKAKDFSQEVNGRKVFLDDELNTLKKRLLEEAKTGTDYQVVSEIQLAIEASAAKNEVSLRQHLANAGAWALEVAKQIGLELAATELKHALVS